MKLSVRKMAVAGVLAAVSIVMGLVPWLGFIPVPMTVAQNATVMQIPAILAAIAEGPVVGGFVGLIFGLLSFSRATVPMFKDPILAIVPRICIGIVASLAYVGLRRWGRMTALIGSAILGTATNTVLVLSLAVLRGYMTAPQAVATGLIHGLPEIVVAALIITPVGMALARVGYIDRPDQNRRRAA